jgi:NADH-quinone oxidoreductase subunit C
MIPPELAHVDEIVALLEWDSEAIAGALFDRDQLILTVPAQRIRHVCEFLKVRLDYDFLADITAVDWHPSEPRFEIVYHLRCYHRKQLLRLKCRVDSGHPEVASVRPVWPAADWYEREIYDLFGIRFAEHPNLRRILLPDDWEGYPLRKNYPVAGYR